MVIFMKKIRSAVLLFIITNMILNMLAAFTVFADTTSEITGIAMTEEETIALTPDAEAKKLAEKNKTVWIFISATATAVIIAASIILTKKHKDLVKM